MGRHAQVLLACSRLSDIQSPLGPGLRNAHAHKHALTHTNCQRILLRWICPHGPVQKHVWFKTHAFPYVYGNYKLHTHKQFSFRRLYLWLSVMENITLLLVNLGEFHIIRDVVMFSYPDVLCIADNIFCRAVLQSWQNIIWESESESVASKFVCQSHAISPSATLKCVFLCTQSAVLSLSGLFSDSLPVKSCLCFGTYLLNLGPRSDSHQLRGSLCTAQHDI